MLFGEGISISDAKYNEWLNGGDTIEDGWLSRVNFVRKLRLAQAGSGYRGDAVLKVWQDEEGNARLSVIPAEYWIPVTSLQDETYIIKDMLVKELDLDELQKKEFRSSYGETNKKKIVRVETYEVGQNTYQAFLKVGDIITAQLEWNTEQLGELPPNVRLDEDGKTYIEETGYDFSMIQRIPCREQDDTCYGKPFITDTFKEQERELCIRATQRGRILDKDADPGMTGPEEVLGIDPTTGQNIVRTQGKYIPRQKDDAEVKYITWEGNLGESREAEKKAIEYINMEVGTNAAAIAATTEGINILSGAALEKVMSRPISVVRTLKMNWKPAILRILRLAFQIENGADNLRPDLLFTDGIPESREQEIKNITSANGNLSVISQREGIRRANPTFSDEQVEEMYQEIMKEQTEREGIMPQPNETIEFGE